MKQVKDHETNRLKMSRKDRDLFLSSSYETEQVSFIFHFVSFFIFSVIFFIILKLKMVSLNFTF